MVTEATTSREKYLPMFVNSIPHSGTHLVSSILDGLGYRHDELRNRFYSHRPYYRRWQRTGINWRTATDLKNYFHPFSESVLVGVTSPRRARVPVLRGLLSRPRSGTYVIGHLPYSEAAEAIVASTVVRTITIVRDPRDMALSMLSHVSSRPAHHAYEHLINTLKSDTERLECILFGYVAESGSLLGINEIYRSMLNWSKDDSNLLIRFEDLVGAKGGGDDAQMVETIRSIVEHVRSELEGPLPDLSTLGANAFGKTTTFRAGQLGKWREAFDAETKALYRENCKDLLLELGYS